MYAYCRRHPHLRTGLSMSSSYICPLVHIQRGFLLQYLYEVDNNKNNVRISVLQTLLVKFISSFHALIILNYLNVHLSSAILPRFLTFTQISVKSTEYKDGEDSTFYSVDLKRDYSYCIKFIGKKKSSIFSMRLNIVTCIYYNTFQCFLILMKKIFYTSCTIYNHMILDLWFSNHDHISFSLQYAVHKIDTYEVKILMARYQGVGGGARLHLHSPLNSTKHFPSQKFTGKHSNCNFHYHMLFGTHYFYISFLFFFYLFHIIHGSTLFTVKSINSHPQWEILGFHNPL